MSKHLIPGSPTYISNCYTPNQEQPGAVYFDSGTQSLMVYDGSSWISLSTPEPTLTFEAEEAIDRVIELMKGQATIADMADKYPLVEEALGQLEVALKLCQNLNDTK